MKLYTYIIGLLIVIATPLSVYAAPTAPQKIVYNGHLLTSSDQALTTAHTLRFSIWRSTDIVAGDIAGGSINGAAPNYLNWQETHTVTPDTSGYFSVELGSNIPLFDITVISAADLQSMFLQIEVKEASEPNTSYEVLDIQPSNASIDRTPVLSVPYALNADYLDQREVGTGSGDIAILSENGVFTPSQIPGATTADTFVLDENDSSSGSIILQFGNALAKTLSYDQVNGYFAFNDDVRIDGNLFVTGLINGVDISTLASSTDRLKVQSGTGLTISVTGGDYRLNETSVNYAGAIGISVQPNTTNYIAFTATGLQVTQASFPAADHIQLATVVTNGSNVITTSDRRETLTNDGSTTDVISAALTPLYPQTTYNAATANDVGTLKLDFDAPTEKNFYNWNTTKNTLQGYTIITDVPLPSNFVSFTGNPLSFEYRTGTNNVADNLLTIQVLDTTSSSVTIIGASSNLANINWTTTDVTFGGTPTFAAAQVMKIKVTVQATNNGSAQSGKLTLRYNVQ